MYWRDFVSQLSIKTPIDKVWKIFKCIQGKTPPDNFPLSSQIPLSPSDKANKIAEHYSIILSHEIQVQNKEELCIEVNTAIACIGGELDAPFNMEELNMVLDTLPKKKAVGIDDIPYEFLERLPCHGKSFLLQICTSCILQEDFPKVLKHQLILPFLKPGKDPSLPDSYRPISLLSTIGKVIEKIIYNRLYWFLETNNSLPSYQAGFRQQRSSSGADM